MLLTQYQALDTRTPDFHPRLIASLRHLAVLPHASHRTR